MKVKIVFLFPLFQPIGELLGELRDVRREVSIPICTLVVRNCCVWYYYYCGTAIAACITFNINYNTYIYFFLYFRSFISYSFTVVVVAADCVALAFAKTKNACLTWWQLRNVLIENAFIWWSQRYLCVISPLIIRDLHDYRAKEKWKKVSMLCEWIMLWL